MSPRWATVIGKLFTQAAPHSGFGNPPVLYRNSEVQGPIRGKGHYRPLTPFSAKDLSLEMKEGKRQISRIPFPSLSEFCCQSVILITELGSRERRRDWRDWRTSRHNWTQQGDTYRLSGWWRLTAGKIFLLVSNMQLPLFHHLLVLIHSLLNCLTLSCTYTQHNSMKLSQSLWLALLFIFPEELQGCRHPAGSDMTDLPQNCKAEQQTESCLRVLLTEISQQAGLAGLTSQAQCWWRAACSVLIFQVALLEPGTAHTCVKHRVGLTLFRTRGICH